MRALVMRIVIDTNVFLSGLAYPESIPGKILKAWRNANFEWVLSEYILDEISRTLPRMHKRLPWDQTKISYYVKLLRFHAEIVNIDHIKIAVPADSKDSPILATFIAGKADYLITGDQDLLALNDRYAILTPQEFVERHIG